MAVFCPILSKPQVKKEFDEIADVTGETGAYHIWNKQNGESIDKAPNGKPSILFDSLLKFYDGDRAAAIRAKAKTYTKSFGKYFNGSTAVDENGEPLVLKYTDKDGDEALVYVFDPNWEEGKQLDDVDVKNIKSVDNTGSFNRSTKNIYGDSSDLDFITNLSESISRYDKELFRETEEELEKFVNNQDPEAQKAKLLDRLIKLNGIILQAIRNRLFVLNKLSDAVSAETRSALKLLLGNTEKKITTLLTSVLTYINLVNNEIMSVSDTAKELSKLEGQALANRMADLIKLKQEFYDFYCPVFSQVKDIFYKSALTEIFSTLPGGRNQVNEIFNEVTAIDNLLLHQAGVINSKIREAAKYKIGEIGHEVNSPTIDAYLSANDARTTYDCNWLTMALGSGNNMADEAARALFHLISKTNFNIEVASYKRTKRLQALLKKVGHANQRKMVELDERGVPTGYMIRKKKYGQFYRDYSNALTKIRADLGILDTEDLRSCDPLVRKEYFKQRNKWLSEHCERKYTNEYYDLFNNLSVEATDARDAIQLLIGKLLDAARGEDGIPDPSRLSSIDQTKLKLLYRERRLLTSEYDLFGNKKTGTELEIALELKELDKAMLAGFNRRMNQEKFEKLLALKQHDYQTGKITGKEYNNWIKWNTRTEYDELFWEDLKTVSKREVTDESAKKAIDALVEQRNQILRQLTDPISGEIEELPDARTIKILNSIEVELNKIRRKYGKKLKNGVKFSDIARRLPTTLFRLLQAEFSERGEYDQFRLIYCDVDMYGNETPKSFLTKIVPLKKAYIHRLLPSYFFQELDPDSPFVNKNFVLDEDNKDESYIPKGEEYDNSKAYDALQKDENLKALYDACLEEMEKGIKKLTNLHGISKYRLPLIMGTVQNRVKSKGLRRGIGSSIADAFVQRDLDLGMNSSSNEGGLSLSDEQSRFVPENYVRSLDDPGSITHNTVGSILLFGKMADNFEQKNAIRATTEGILNFLATRELYSKDKTNKKGEVVKEGSKLKEGTQTLLYQWASNFVRLLVYDMKTLPIYWHIPSKNIRIFNHDFLTPELRLNISKALKVLQHVGTTVNLGLNLIPAMTGGTTAFMGHLANAFAGRYYSAKDAMHGGNKMAEELLKSGFGMGLLSDNTNSLLTHLMEYFDVGASLRTDRLHMSTLSKQLLRNWAFGIWSIPDYLNKGLILNSVMYNFRYVPEAKVFMNHEEYEQWCEEQESDEMLANVRKKLWNRFTGSRDMVKYDAENNDIVTKDVKYQQAWDAKKLQIGDTARLLAQLADGMLTPLQKTLLSSNAFGSLLLMHRQYMPVIIQQNWSMQRIWDYDLQRYREATFRSGIKAVSGIFNAIRSDSRNIAHIRLVLHELPPEQQEAFNRIAFYTTTLSAMRYVLIPFANAWAEDDKKNWIKQAIAFILLRTYWELMLAQTPFFLTDAIQTFKSPFPVYNWFDNMTGILPLLGKTTTDFLSSGEVKKINKGAYKNWYPYQRQLLKLTPFKNLWELQDIPSKRRYYETQLMGMSDDDFRLPWQSDKDTFDIENINLDDYFPKSQD